MGYESKLFVVRRNVLNWDGKKPATIWGEELAQFDLKKFADEKFTNTGSSLFRTPIDFDLYIMELVEDKGEYNENDKSFLARVVDGTREDKYGDVCMYAPIDDVIDELEEWTKHDSYGLAEYVYASLSAIREFTNESEDAQIVVVHYGH